MRFLISVLFLFGVSCSSQAQELPFQVLEDSDSQKGFFKRFSPERTIYLIGPLSARSLEVFRQELLSMDAKDSTEPICIVIDSKGLYRFTNKKGIFAFPDLKNCTHEGDTSFFIRNLMTIVRAPLTTVGIGVLDEASLIVLLSGSKTERFVFSNCSIHFSPLLRFFEFNTSKGAHNYRDFLRRFDSKFKSLLTSLIGEEKYFLYSIEYCVTVKEIIHFLNNKSDMEEFFTALLKDKEEEEGG